MSENENQIRKLENSSKRNVYLSLLSVFCLIVSLAVFYPLSMKVDTYGNTTLAIFAYSFYIIQGASLSLAIFSFVNGTSSIRARKHIRNYFTCIAAGLVLAIFVYELYWFLNHI